MTRTTLTLPTPTTILIERRFDAPVALVYAAHTEPQHVTQWHTGPAGWRMVSATMDVRAGGRYMWQYTSPQGSTLAITGEYLEVDPPRRLVTRDDWGPEMPAPIVETAFVDDAGQALVRVTFTLPDPTARDTVLSLGGLGSGYDESHQRLDRLLAAQPS